MKPRKIYFLAALMSVAFESKIYAMEIPEEETTLFANDHWRSVSSGIFAQGSWVMANFEEKKYKQIVILNNLVDTYVSSMGAKIQEWQKNQDPRFLEALGTITSSGKLKRALDPYLKQIFDFYIASKQFDRAYGMKLHFQTFRGQAHGFFKENDFAAAIPLLQILLEMYPTNDSEAAILTAQDRFYLMTALMRVKEYTKAEKLSSEVLGFIPCQPSRKLNHLQLSICAVNAFAVNDHNKVKDIINQKMIIGEPFSEDYVIGHLY